MQKQFFVILFGLLLPFAGMAQSEQADPPEHRQYATQARLRYLQLTAPDVAETMSAIERFTADFRSAGRIDTITVAVVFHLMPLPDGTPPPTAVDLQAQLDRLNTDFFAPDHPYLAKSYQSPATLVDTLGNITGTEADRQSYRQESDRLERFAERAGRPLIRFCMATTGPDGQPTTGVVQPAGVPRVWRTDDNSIGKSESGGSDAWAPARYCNIWIARLAGDYAGFAQMPGGPPATDGIVIDDRFFGRVVADKTNPYHLGKTLTHLMGSYLNLYELWNEQYPCADDYLEDTPIHNAPNFGLPAYGYQHISTCDGNPVEMLSNLMDNTPDTAQYLFTWGQVMRMQATLAEGGPRGTLRFTPTNCFSDGVIVQEGDDRIAPESDAVHNQAFDLRVFPNPATGRFTLEIWSEREIIADMQVYSAAGALVTQQAISLLQGRTYRDISATNWSPGLYTIRVSAGRNVGTKKALVEKP